MFDQRSPASLVFQDAVENAQRNRIVRRKHTQTADDVDDVWTGGELDLPPSNLTSFMMFSTIAYAIAATIMIDGTGELRFLPSNPNIPGPADVFGNRVGRERCHRQCEDRTRSGADRQRLDDDFPHTNKR
jgi:hypothetical protein